MDIKQLYRILPMPEITEQLDISQEHLYSLEMHSFVNIITLMYNNLFLMSEESDYPELFEESMNMVYDIAEGVRTRDRTKFNPGKLRAYKKTVTAMFDRLNKERLMLRISREKLELRQVFDDILDVLLIRIDEILLHWTNPYRWSVYWVEEFETKFRDYFYALEKNVEGSYRIVQNIAEGIHGNYRVLFRVNSVTKHSISLPVVIRDIMRDLITNARNYTKPGGRISVVLDMTRTSVKLTVQDNGIGIPEDEILNVVKYRYRASNARELVQVPGNGYGLTKVLYNTRQLGGRMWIDSKLNFGTTVKLEIPLPDQEYMNANFGAV